MKRNRLFTAFVLMLSILFLFNTAPVANASEAYSYDEKGDNQPYDASGEQSSEGADYESEYVPPVFDMDNYTFEKLYMSLDIPSDLLTVTRETKRTDEVFSKLKKTYEETIREMKEANCYLMAYPEDFSFELTVEMHTDSESKEIYDFNLLTEDQLRAVKDSLSNSGLYHSVSHPAHTQAIFFNLGIEYDDESGKKYYGAQSYTIINGMQITITLTTFTGEDLTPEQYSMATQILKSVNFSKVSEKPEAVDNTDQYIIVIVIIALIIGVALALIIVIMMYRKNTKTLMSMEDELEDKYAVKEKTLRELIKDLYRKIRKNSMGYDGDDDEFIYNFDYSYIDNNDTQFDISIDDINAEIERRNKTRADNGNNKTKKQNQNNKKSNNKNNTTAKPKDKKSSDTKKNNADNSGKKKKRPKVKDFDIFKS
ncbi:MAG: hypothetical protein ACI4II_09695 [Acutalibacteraceae bacterium]